MANAKCKNTTHDDIQNPQTTQFMMFHDFPKYTRFLHHDDWNAENFFVGDGCWWLGDKFWFRFTLHKYGVFGWLPLPGLLVVNPVLTVGKVVNLYTLYSNPTFDIDKKNECFLHKYFIWMHNFPQKGFLMGKISHLKLEPETYTFPYLQ